MQRKFLQNKILILLLLISLKPFAQNGFVKGKITFENDKGSIASITIAKLRKATTTNNSGEYIISIPVGLQTLNISAVGYKTKSIAVDIVLDSTIILNIIFENPCKKYNKKNKVCPICHKKNRVIPIVYGLRIGEVDKEETFLGGCEITGCDPNWYCKRDKYQF